RAIIGQKLAAFTEKHIVVADADVLEHADRDDAVEPLLHVAVILHSEIDPAAQTLFACTFGGSPPLLARQRDAGHRRAAELRQIERKAAPAAADVEYAPLVAQQQFGREVALLGELGVVERLAKRLEVAAAVLPVGVEEQRIEPRVEIVMV